MAYSAFNYETLRYLQEGARLYAFANIALMLIGCLAAGAAGLWVAGEALPAQPLDKRRRQRLVVPAVRLADEDSSPSRGRAS